MGKYYLVLYTWVLRCGSWSKYPYTNKFQVRCSHTDSLTNIILHHPSDAEKPTITGNEKGHIIKLWFFYETSARKCCDTNCVDSLWWNLEHSRTNSVKLYILYIIIAYDIEGRILFLSVLPHGQAENDLEICFWINPSSNQGLSYKTYHLVKLHVCHKEIHNRN